VEEIDLYWDFPQYIFIRGEKMESDRTERNIARQLGNSATLTAITFHEDFLLWLLHEYEQGQSLGKNFRADLLTDCEITGDDDHYGGRNEVGDSADISESVALLGGLLRGKKFSKIEGVFSVKGDNVSAKISTKGRIQVLASKKTLREATNLRRIAISLTFLRKIMSAYQRWQRLPGKYKYPNDQYFVDMRDKCLSQGVEIKHPIDNVVNEYREKRRD
jgi:hypothetical protein